MFFLPVCIFQFTHPRTFSPYIFNAKTVDSTAKYITCKHSFFRLPSALIQPDTYHQRCFAISLNRLPSALIQSDTYHQRCFAVSFNRLPYALIQSDTYHHAALPFPSIVYPPHLSSLILIIR